MHVGTHVCMVMAYIVMACVAMAYRVMAYIVLTYIVMAYIVMAYMLYWHTRVERCPCEYNYYVIITNMLL